MLLSLLGNKVTLKEYQRIKDTLLMKKILSPEERTVLQRWVVDQTPLTLIEAHCIDLVLVGGMTYDGDYKTIVVNANMIA